MAARGGTMVDGADTEAIWGLKLALLYDATLDVKRKNDRRKGETTGRMNERNYPHIVELPVPFGGFRETGFAIVAFHRSAELQRVWSRPQDEGQWYARYCFADPTVADAFRNQFGGERLTSPSER